MFQKNSLKTPIGVWGHRGHKGHFGVEIELEGVGHPVECPGWQIHQEGSIRGGAEYVTSTPHDIPGVIDRLRVLNDAFRQHGVVNQNSHRTSTHIHVNVQHETFQTIIGVMILFSIIEPLFLRLCGRDRDGNLFCLSTYDTGDFPEYFRNFLESVRYGMENGFPERGKYSAMNTDPIRRFGSIEFRSFPATTNPQQIVQWCEWLGNIVRMVKACPDKTFYELYRRFKSDPIINAQTIFNGVDIMAVCRPNSVHELILFGCEEAHELCRDHRIFFKKGEEEEKPKEKKVFPQANINWGRIDDWRA